MGKREKTQRSLNRTYIEKKIAKNLTNHPITLGDLQRIVIPARSQQDLLQWVDEKDISQSHDLKAAIKARIIRMILEPANTRPDTEKNLIKPTISQAEELTTQGSGSSGYAPTQPEETEYDLGNQSGAVDGGLWRGAEEYAKKVHMEGIAIQNSREIICNSQFTYDDLHRYYTISRNQKVHCLPLGIYKENYPYKPCIGNKKVCYFGRLDSQKGIHWLLRDLVDRKDWWKENPLIVLGEGAYEPVICRAQRDGLVDFRWAVSKDEMKDILSGVKYCVFPSIYEPYCLALNEALCMGKICIVAATGGGMLEQVENGKNGFVIDFWYSFLADYIDNLEENVSSEDFTQISEEAHKNSRGIKDHLLALGDVLW